MPFQGVKSPPDPPEERLYYRGSPCLLKAHSKHGSPTWRDDHTHACMECLEEIEKGRFSLSLDNFHPKEVRNVVRFWENVEIGGWDDCWPWLGPLRRDKRLSHTWKRPIKSTYRFHPQTVLQWVTRGDVGRLGTVSLCNQNRCCNPLHQVPIGYLDSLDYYKNDRERLDTELDLLKSQLNEIHSQQLLADEMKEQSSVSEIVNERAARAYDKMLYNLVTKAKIEEMANN